MGHDPFILDLGRVPDDRRREYENLVVKEQLSAVRDVWILLGTIINETKQVLNENPSSFIDLNGTLREPTRRLVETFGGPEESLIRRRVLDAMLSEVVPPLLSVDADSCERENLALQAESAGHSSGAAAPSCEDAPRKKRKKKRKKRKKRSLLKTAQILVDREAIEARTKYEADR